MAEGSGGEGHPGTGRGPVALNPRDELQRAFRKKSRDLFIRFRKKEYLLPWNRKKRKDR